MPGLGTNTTRGTSRGAVWVDAKAVEKRSAQPGGLADDRGWESWIEPLGIDPQTRALVCDAKRQLDAARVWWLLSYLGVEHVGLIDGGFPLWMKEHRPVTIETSKIRPRHFTVHFRSDRFASRTDVLEAWKQSNSLVIDARSKGEHPGETKRSKRGGHIPGACSLEWSKLVDADGRFLDEPALKAILTKAGVKIEARDPVITHCQGGGRSSVDGFVFEHLGFPPRNSYRGWSEGGNADDTPVESGPAKSKAALAPSGTQAHALPLVDCFQRVALTLFRTATGIIDVSGAKSATVVMSLPGLVCVQNAK